MAMRLSGLMSGMDTETIVSQLVEARKTKVTKAVKAQKSLKYKQDAWKTLNTQIVSLYSKTLSNLRFESSFKKKTTKVSNSSVVSVITGEGAMNSVQSLEVGKLARSGYLTGGQLKVYTEDEFGYKTEEKVTGRTTLKDLGFTGKGEILVQTGNSIDSRTPIIVDENTTISSFVGALNQAGVNASFDETNGRIYVASKASGKDNDFSITSYDFEKDGGVGGLKALQALKLNFDTNDAAAGSYLQELKDQYENDRRDAKDLRQGVFKMLEFDRITGEVDTSGWKAGTTTDADGKVEWNGEYRTLEEIKAEYEKSLANGYEEIYHKYENKLAFKAEDVAKKDYSLKSDTGLVSYESQKQDAQDAEISLNGVVYTSSSNNFQVNGLTLAVSNTTEGTGPVTLTTEDDTEGIYDMIKNFFKEYNALINQMDKLYNADSAKGYEPLTDEEKEAMSDSQIEEWENKIKESILRKDSSLSTISNAMKTIMMQGVDMKTGQFDDEGKEITKKMYLSNFGINTLGYFLAPDNEKNAYHIDGDSDDGDTAGNADKLKSMIANDPDTVIEFFTGLANNLYQEMFKRMDTASEFSSFHTAYDDKKMQKEYDEYTSKIKDLEDKLADYEDKWYAKFAAMETALAKMQNNASAVTALLGG